jgi:hypothetical protein
MGGVIARPFAPTVCSAGRLDAGWWETDIVRGSGEYEVRVVVTGPAGRDLEFGVNQLAFINSRLFAIGWRHNGEMERITGDRSLIDFQLSPGKHDLPGELSSLLCQNENDLGDIAVRSGVLMEPVTGQICSKRAEREKENEGQRSQNNVKLHDPL